MVGVLDLLGSGVSKRVPSSFAVTAGTERSVAVAPGLGVAYHSIYGPSVLRLESTDQTVENLEANRGADDPLYIFAAWERTPSHDASRDGIPIVFAQDNDEFDGGLLLAKVTTSATDVLTVTDLRPVITLGDMVQAVYDANGNGIVDNAEKLAGQTLAQVRNRGAHTGTQDISTINGLQDALSSKAAVNHTHTQSEVIGLTDSLAGKANIVHTHTASQVTDFDTQVRTSRLDQLAAPTADVSAGGQKITNLGAPVLSTDAARKADVDAARNGLIIKDPVRAATTANIALSGTQTIDGVALVAGDRVLVKNQTTGSQNGIYVVATGAWSRATDADTNAEVKGGMACWVDEGATNSDRQFALTTNNPITLDTTSLSFTQSGTSGGVSTVNGQSGTAVLDDTNINGQDPANGGASATLRTIFTNLFTAIGNRAPKGPATASGLTMATSRILGRATANTGALEEISIGTGLSLAGGILSAPGDGNGYFALNVTGMSGDQPLSDAAAACGVLYFYGAPGPGLNIIVPARRQLWAVFASLTGSNAVLAVKTAAAGNGAGISSNVYGYMTCDGTGVYPALSPPEVGGSYTVTNAPAPSNRMGQTIWVTDGADGSPCGAISNGTNWLRLTTGAAIAASSGPTTPGGTTGPAPGPGPGGAVVMGG